ncbi:MAG: DUF2721 domain-containing protein [Anaerolineales bacterium]
MNISVAELIPVLQTAIGPVVLISGIGLLILSMTNRLGRIVDRGRSLTRELVQLPEQLHARVKAQLRILSQRATLMRRAITFATVSVLLAAVLIILLFLTAVLQIESGWPITITFVSCLLALILSLVFFLQDLNQSLVAFHLDIGQ